ncbi:DNRLRE domain-containing protein [Candidatus Borrarchaeum sp.]|uniref:CBM96 family carbohydrate-binding protein n=1 Tax=Candidatus Borrarchaeum sp. TaxID=2846742 RepID=UPI0025802080|nr:DNRLRE domain-containing protein [Candidatus Borrarchaeum sp.]
MRKICCWIILALFVGSVFFVSVTTAQEDIELEPIADTYIRATDPDENYGDETYLRVGDARLSNDYIRITYLLFDLSAIDGSIQEATLKLYLKWSWEARYIGIHECDDTNWNEDTLTWNNAPSYNSEAVDSFNVSRTLQWNEWDATDIAKGKQGQLVTIVVKARDPVNKIGDWTDFASKENDRNHPVLVINQGSGGFSVCLGTILLCCTIPVLGLGVLSKRIRTKVR